MQVFFLPDEVLVTWAHPPFEDGNGADQAAVLVFVSVGDSLGWQLNQNTHQTPKQEKVGEGRSVPQTRKIRFGRKKNPPGKGLAGGGSEYENEFSQKT